MSRGGRGDPKDVRAERKVQGPWELRVSGATTLEAVWPLPEVWVARSSVGSGVQTSQKPLEKGEVE